MKPYSNNYSSTVELQVLWPAIIRPVSVRVNDCCREGCRGMIALC
jgi:hypothetical protein